MQRHLTRTLAVMGLMLPWTLAASAQVAPVGSPPVDGSQPAVLPPAPPPSPIQVPVAPAVVETANPKVVTRCERALHEATTAFKQGDYDSTIKILNQALTQCPDDPTLHELRSLVYFAKGDYETASNSSHIALANGRKYWKWPDLIRLYPDVATYTKQLRLLEAHTRKHPSDAGGRFVQAYHYIVAGYPEAAAHELELVVRLQGDDALAIEILKTVAKPATPQPVVRQP